ncbi:MAG: phosphopentomutase [Oscillospiraceae bacterium]|nr:phosphopentomutase [Oscillospiraceae bacterium]
MKRVILIVFDSFGIGELPDAKEYHDEGSNTLCNIAKKVPGFSLPNLEKMGLSKVDGVNCLTVPEKIKGAYGRCIEISKGKDTITGHWEIAGVILDSPLNVYPNGFDKHIIDEFCEKTNKKACLGNIVASGTEIIKDLGDEHVKTGFPIVYTSADSVFQIAAHEDVIPLPELYHMCEIAREMLVGDKCVGRIIARPFIGTSGNYTRTSNRRDYAIDPPTKTMLQYINEDSKKVFAVGKIEDIFNKHGIDYAVHIINNNDGIDKTLDCMDKLKEDGLIFTNLVDFDMLYGHRNDFLGYAKALIEADKRMDEVISKMVPGDMLIITADHGCDPTTESTDHSREYIPLLVYTKNMERGINLGTRDCFCDIGKTILDYLDVENKLNGVSFLSELRLL